MSLALCLPWLYQLSLEETMNHIYLLATIAQHTRYNQVNIGHIDHGTLSLWWVHINVCGNAPVAFLVLNSYSRDFVRCYCRGLLIWWTRGRCSCEVDHPPKLGERYSRSSALQGHITPLHHRHPVCGCGHHRSSWN